MPATTPLGVPYPVGTDRVADGDNAIQSVAEWLDRSITWGACTVGASGPGVGGTMWFSTCSSIGASPGVTVGANGITVPRKGWYAISAMAGIGWTSGTGNQTALFIGDGSSVWARAYVLMVTVGSVQHSVSCQSAVFLNAGSMVRWGIANVGSGAGGVTGGPADANLIVRLLHPVA
jgi:hypothetical protein